MDVIDEDGGKVDIKLKKEKRKSSSRTIVLGA